MLKNVNKLPQGVVPSTTLFNIDINDFSKSIETERNDDLHR